MGRSFMSLNTVDEIERAIGALTPQEWEELRLRLDQYYQPQPIDLRIQADAVAGRLDQAVQRALDNEKNGDTQPL
jgi:hypothetical protein